MQYIKLELPREKKELKYPKGYDILVNFITDHIYVDEKNSEGGVEKTVLCMAVMDGVDHTKIFEESALAEKLTKEEMIAYCKPYEVIRETITDEARVRRLAIKAQLGKKLDSTEELALDPNTDVPGFGLSKRFIDRI